MHGGSFASLASKMQPQPSLGRSCEPDRARCGSCSDGTFTSKISNGKFTSNIPSTSGRDSMPRTFVRDCIAIATATPTAIVSAVAIAIITASAVVLAIANRCCCFCCCCCYWAKGNTKRTLAAGQLFQLCCRAAFVQEENILIFVPKNKPLAHISCVCDGLYGDSYLYW